jgi:hypothetical protein
LNNGPCSKMHFGSFKIHSPKAKLQSNAFEIAARATIHRDAVRQI